MVMAANTPMLLKAALVDGKVESGVLASGQVVGVIDDLPTCKELIDRIDRRGRRRSSRTWRDEMGDVDGDQRRRQT